MMTSSACEFRTYDFHEILQMTAVVGLLEAMLDPVSRATASAPVDDEPETEEERDAVAASNKWLAENPGEGIANEELIREFGLEPEDLRD